MQKLLKGAKYLDDKIEISQTLLNYYLHTLNNMVVRYKINPSIDALKTIYRFADSVASDMETAIEELDETFETIDLEMCEIANEISSLGENDVAVEVDEEVNKRIIGSAINMEMYRIKLLYLTETLIEGKEIDMSELIDKEIKLPPVLSEEEIAEIKKHILSL